LGAEFGENAVIHLAGICAAKASGERAEVLTLGAFQLVQVEVKSSNFDHVGVVVETGASVSSHFLNSNVFHWHRGGSQSRASEKTKRKEPGRKVVKKMPAVKLCVFAPLR